MAPQGHGVDEEQLADFGVYLGMEGYLTLRQIQDFAIGEGLNPDGFAGLMSPLADACTGPGTRGVEAAMRMMQEKLCNLGDAVVAAAKRYGYDEESNKSVLERTDDSSHLDYRRYLPESLEDYLPQYPDANAKPKPEPPDGGVGGGSGGGGGGSSAEGTSGSGGGGW